MHLSGETIKTYRKRVMLKMACENMAHCIGQAYREGILDHRRELL